jgi:hypothetical protein
MAKSAVEKYQPGPKRSIIKAAFDLEAAKKNYQGLLNHLAGIVITKDNVNDDVSKEAREVVKALTQLKDNESKDPLQTHRDIMSVFNELADPIKAQVDRISKEKGDVAIKLQKEAAQQLAEQTRINNAKQAIIDFANKIAGMIGDAKTDTDIVSIEKLIGSEGRKSSVYHEFLPDLIQKCEALKPEIKAQKESIRELQRIENDKKLASESGDIQALTDLKEKEERVTGLLQDRAIRIHEEAFNQALTVDVVAPEVAEDIPKGRTNWKWRVDDIKHLAKKMPHLVKMVPDEDAIDVLLATKRKDGSLDGKLEENWNGILFFNDKTFK